MTAICFLCNKLKKQYYENENYFTQTGFTAN
jgi:hypothetical protein